MSKKARDLVGSMTTYYGVESENIKILEKVREIVNFEDKADILKEIDKRISFIRLCNTGKQSCKQCRGRGICSDGRGDIHICSDCHPSSELDRFWRT